MATDPKEIQRLLDQLDIAYKRLGERNPFANFDINKITDAEEEIAKLEIALEGVRSRIDTLNTSFLDLSKTLKNIVKEINPNAFNATKDFERGFKNIIKEAKQLSYEEEGISKLSEAQLQKIKSRIEYQKFETKIAAERVLSESEAGREAFKYKDTINSTWEAYGKLNEAQKSALEYLRDESSAIDVILEKIGKRLDQEEKIVRVMGLGGNVIGGLEQSLNKIGLGGLSKVLGIDEAKSEMEDLARKIVEGKQKELELTDEINKLEGKTNISPDESEKLNSLKEELRQRKENNNELTRFGERTSVLGKGIATLGSNLKRNLTDPLLIGGVLVAKIIDGFLEINKQNTEFGRLTGQTINHFDTLNTEMITTTDYMKQAVALSQELGVNAQDIFGAETLTEVTKMVELMGMTNKEAAGMAKLSKLSGKELENINNNLIKQTNEFIRTNRVSVNHRQILQEVANVSAGIAISLGGNTEKIGAAVLEAKKLGMTLEQVDKTASSLLDFQSSIEAEMEAELLTGKQINLEQARYYALTNDIEGLTKEIGNNQEILNSFSSGNRIQQEAIAKSLGMSREELAQSVYQAQIAKGLSIEQAAAAAGVKKEDMERLAVQEQINKSIAKMGEALAGPLEMFTNLIGHSWIFYGLLTSMGVIITMQLVKGIASFGKEIALLIPKLAVKLGLEQASAVANISSMSALTLGIGAIAAIAGIIAVTSAMKSASSSVKDAKIDTKKGVMFSGEFGSVRLDERDQAVLKDGKLAAGTDLFKSDNTSIKTPPPTISVKPPAPPPINLSSLESKMDKLEQTNALLGQLIKKDTSVTLDGAKVGKGIALAESKFG